MFRVSVSVRIGPPGIRDAPSTAGNSMTGSERPSPEPLPKKEASPAVLGGENSGNALEASNALNYRVWGIPAVLSRGIPGNALRAFPGSFRNFSGISSGNMERKKTDKEKSHKGIWRSGCPGGVPGTNSGRPRDTWDIWAWFMSVNQ